MVLALKQIDRVHPVTHGARYLVFAGEIIAQIADDLRRFPVSVLILTAQQILIGRNALVSLIFGPLLALRRPVLLVDIGVKLRLVVAARSIRITDH